MEQNDANDKVKELESEMQIMRKTLEETIQSRDMQISTLEMQLN